MIADAGAALVALRASLAEAGLDRVRVADAASWSAAGGQVPDRAAAAGSSASFGAGARQSDADDGLTVPRPGHDGPAATGPAAATGLHAAGRTTSRTQPTRRVAAPDPRAAAPTAPRGTSDANPGGAPLVPGAPRAPIGSADAPWRTVIVVGNTAALWGAFTAEMGRNPRRLMEEAHPLDAYVRQAVATADAALSGFARRWVFADLAETCSVDFRRLAERAGLGVRGRLELLLDPEVGPWLGLRAACFVDAALPVGEADGAPCTRQQRGSVDGPLIGWDPCGDCAKQHPEGVPCARACPGGAFATGALDIRACVAFRERDTACATSCASRRACPIGAERAYSSEQEAYHMDPGRSRSHGHAHVRPALVRSWTAC